MEWHLALYGSSLAVLTSMLSPLDVERADWIQDGKVGSTELLGSSRGGRDGPYKCHIDANTIGSTGKQLRD